MFRKIIILSLVSFNVYADRLNPNIIQENINTTICVPNHTKTIRPSTNITNTIKIKIKMMEDLKIPKSKIKKYQLDHIVPLSLGGAINDLEKYQLQSYVGKYNAHDKDAVEHKIHKDVCEHEISLNDAQEIFLNNTWMFYD